MSASSPDADASSSAEPTSLSAPSDAPADAVDLSPRTQAGRDAGDLSAWGERDGAAGLPRSPSETLIAQSVACDRVDQELDELRDRLDRVDDRLDEVRTLRADVATTTAEVDRLETEQEEARQTLDDAEMRLEAVEEEQHAKSSRGSTLYAALYTIAGLFFIAGDIIMSREIVADALKLGGDVEPWIFAVGLGMLAILLKPAYDRLVESRWWQGQQTAFGIVISVCALGAVGTLWILGAFRSTAYVTNSKMQRLTNELMQTSDPQRISEIQQQMSTLQDGLIESPLGYWAFVFSGILFAVAGAVCLGIGIRHLRDAYHLRYRLYRAQKRLEARRDDARETLDALDDGLREKRLRLERLHQKIEDRPSIEALQQRRSRLRAAQRELRDHRAELESRRQQARYRRGHDLGRAGEMPADTGDGAPHVTPSAPNGPSDGPGSADEDRSYTALHPYLQREQRRQLGE